MALDAHDWVDRRLVSTAHAVIGAEQIGAVVDTGFVTDIRTLRAAAVPHRRVFDQESHRPLPIEHGAPLAVERADLLAHNRRAGVHFTALAEQTMTRSRR